MCSVLAGFQKVPEFCIPDNVSGVTLYTSGSILSGSENYYLPDKDPDDDDALDLYGVFIAMSGVGKEFLSTPDKILSLA